MTDRAGHHHESPSLLSGRTVEDEGVPAPSAYELKFHVPTALADEVAAWALGVGGLLPDPHGDPACNGHYITTTLYLDTPALDVYNRREGYGKRRYRLRRYGDDMWAHLECKTKSGDLVSKQRTAVPLDQTRLLAEGGSAGGWSGEWFRDRVGPLGLRPAATVTYQRAAFFGSCPEGPLRVTVDRDARARLCGENEGWAPKRLAEREGTDVLNGRAVVELKYLTSLPLPFKTLMRNLTLHPACVSKYRLGRDAIGGAATAGACPSMELPRA